MISTSETQFIEVLHSHKKNKNEKNKLLLKEVLNPN